MSTREMTVDGLRTPKLIFRRLQDSIHQLLNQTDVNIIIPTACGFIEFECKKTI
jgi:hypothetical protein